MRNVPFNQIEQVVDAVLPTPLQAQRLAMSPSDPCLLLTRRTWTRKLLVTMVRCLHPASRYRLGSRFCPDGNSNAGCTRADQVQNPVYRKLRPAEFPDTP